MMPTPMRPTARRASSPARLEHGTTTVPTAPSLCRPSAAAATSTVEDGAAPSGGGRGGGGGGPLVVVATRTASHRRPSEVAAEEGTSNSMRLSARRKGGGRRILLGGEPLEEASSSMAVAEMNTKADSVRKKARTSSGYGGSWAVRALAVSWRARPRRTWRWSWPRD